LVVYEKKVKDTNHFW